MGNCCSTSPTEEMQADGKFSGGEVSKKKLLSNNVDESKTKPRTSFEDSNIKEIEKTVISCKVCVIPVILGKEITKETVIRETITIEESENLEYTFDVWTKKNTFLERTNPLSSFDSFYKDVDVILIQADFADSWN